MEIITQIERNDTEYQQRFDEAFDIDLAAIRDSDNPSDLSKAELDALYEKSNRLTGEILNECEAANNALAEKAKALLDDYLASSQYDGLTIDHDEGLYSRATMTVARARRN